MLDLSLIRFVDNINLEIGLFDFWQSEVYRLYIKYPEERAPPLEAMDGGRLGLPIILDTPAFLFFLIGSFTFTHAIYLGLSSLRSWI